MVQQAVSAVFEALRTVGNTLIKVAPALALCFAGLSIALVLLWASDKEKFTERWRELGVGAGIGARWGFLTLFLAVCWLSLQSVPAILQNEQTQQAQVPYTTKEDPSSSGVFQYGPLAAYVQERTFTRNLTLPPDFLERIGTNGVEVLSPYLQDPSAENVLRLADTFRRSGRDVIFTREVTRLEETAISIDKADVNVRLDFKETGAAARKSYYEAAFDGNFTFKNPLATTAQARFRFPLPEAGTIRDFEFTVEGKSITEPNDHDQYEWSGELAPGAQATAHIRYRTQGGGSWRYAVASGRRRIDAFNLKVDANEPARFLRGALYPTTRNGSSMSWELKNVITNQQIDIFFPGRGVTLESKGKALVFLPMALAACLVGVALTRTRTRDSLAPSTLTLASLGFVIGLGSLAIWMLYLPLFWAVLLAAGLAAGLGTRVLGWPYLPALGVAAVLPLAYVSEVHSGLIVLVAITLVFVAMLPKPRTEGG